MSEFSCCCLACNTSLHSESMPSTVHVVHYTKSFHFLLLLLFPYYNSVHFSSWINLYHSPNLAIRSSQLKTHTHTRIIPNKNGAMWFCYDSAMHRIWLSLLFNNYMLIRGLFLFIVCCSSSFLLCAFLYSSLCLFASVLLSIALSPSPYPNISAYVDLLVLLQFFTLL